MQKNFDKMDCRSTYTYRENALQKRTEDSSIFLHTARVKGSKTKYKSQMRIDGIQHAWTFEAIDSRHSAEVNNFKWKNFDDLTSKF